MASTFADLLRQRLAQGGAQTVPQPSQGYGGSTPGAVPVTPDQARVEAAQRVAAALLNAKLRQVRSGGGAATPQSQMTQPQLQAAGPAYGSQAARVAAAPSAQPIIVPDIRKDNPGGLADLQAQQSAATYVEPQPTRQFSTTPVVPQAQDIRLLESNVNLPMTAEEATASLAKPDMIAGNEQFIAETQQRIAARTQELIAQGYAPMRAEMIAKQEVTDANLQWTRDNAANLPAPGPLEMVSEISDWYDAGRQAIVGEMGQGAYNVATGSTDSYSPGWGRIAPANWGTNEINANYAFGQWAQDPANAAIIRNAYENGFQADLNSPRYTGGQAVWELFINGRGMLYKTMSDLFNDPLILTAIAKPTGAALKTSGLDNAADGKGIMGAIKYATGSLLEAPQNVMDATVDVPFNAIGSVVGKVLSPAVGSDGAITRRIKQAFDGFNPSARTAVQDVREGMQANLEYGGSVFEGYHPSESGRSGPGGPGSSGTPNGPTDSGPVNPIPGEFFKREVKDAQGNTSWEIVAPDGTVHSTGLPWKPKKGREPNWNSRRVQEVVNELNRPMQVDSMTNMGVVVPPESWQWADPTRPRLTSWGENQTTSGVLFRMTSDLNIPEPTRRAMIEELTPAVEYHVNEINRLDAKNAPGMKQSGVSGEDAVQSGMEIGDALKTLQNVRFYAQDVFPVWAKHMGEPLTEADFVFYRGNDINYNDISSLIEHGVFGTRDIDNFIEVKGRMVNKPTPGTASKARKYIMDKRLRAGSDDAAIQAEELRNILREMKKELFGEESLSRNPSAVKSRAAKARAASVPKAEQMDAAATDMGAGRVPSPAAPLDVPTGPKIDPVTMIPAKDKRVKPSAQLNLRADEADLKRAIDDPTLKTITPAGFRISREGPYRTIWAGTKKDANEVSAHIVDTGTKVVIQSGKVSMDASSIGEAVAIADDFLLGRIGSPADLKAAKRAVVQEAVEELSPYEIERNLEEALDSGLYKSPGPASLGPRRTYKPTQPINYDDGMQGYDDVNMVLSADGTELIPDTSLGLDSTLAELDAEIAAYQAIPTLESKGGTRTSPTAYEKRTTLKAMKERRAKLDTPPSIVPPVVSPLRGDPNQKMYRSSTAISDFTDTVYREVNLEDAELYLPRGVKNTEGEFFGDLYVSNDPDLALGQGGNRGALIEMSTDGFTGTVNKEKPGWEFSWQNGSAEFKIGNYGQDTVRKAEQNIRSITIKPDVKSDKVSAARMEITLQRAEAAGWTKRTNPDGSTTYTRPVAEPKSGSPLGIVHPSVRQSMEMDRNFSRLIQEREGAVTGLGLDDVLANRDSSPLGAALRLGIIDQETYQGLSQLVTWGQRNMPLYTAYEQLRISGMEHREAVDHLVNILAPFPEVEIKAKWFAKWWGKLVASNDSAYMTTLTVMRQQQQYNLANGIAKTLGDQIGNTWTLLATGNVMDAVMLMNPINYAKFFWIERGHKETLDHMLQKFDVLGVRPRNSMLELNSGRTEAADGLEMKARDLVKGTWFGDSKVSGAAYGVLANKTIKDFRNGGDRNARFTHYMGSFFREVSKGRAKFYNMVRNRAEVLGQDPEEWVRLVRDLGKEFSNEDIIRVLGDERLARDWREIIGQADRTAYKSVNEKFFTYRQMKIDDKLRYVVFYHYWMSRAFRLHGKEALRKPYLMNAYINMWQGMENEAEEQGYPSGVVGTLRFMREGYIGFFDPLGIIVPFDILLDKAQTDEGVADWVRSHGGFFNPILDGALSYAGFTGRVSDLTQTKAVRRRIKSFVNYMNSNGHEGWIPDQIAEPNTLMVDYVDLVQQRVTEKINSVLPKSWERDFTEPDGYEMDVVRSILMDQMEESLGPNSGWGDQEWEDYLSAQDSILLHRDGNEYADAAVEAYSDAEMAVENLKTIVPGGIYGRYEPRNDEMDARDDGNADARDNRSLATSGSPEDTALTVGINRLEDIGTESGRNAYSAWNEIANLEELPLSAIGTFIEIDGEQIYAGDIANMSYDQRAELADRWVSQYGATEDLASYREERDLYLMKHPEVGDFKEFQKGVYGFDGGPRAWREQYAKTDSDFRTAMEEKEARLRETHTQQAIIDRELDQWAASQEAYKVANGIRDNIYDAPVTPKNPDYGFKEKETSSSSGGSPKAEAKTPLEKTKSTIESYNDKIAKAVAVMNASGYSVTADDLIYANDYYKQAWGLFDIPSMPYDATLYYQWMLLQPSGADTSVDAYLKVLEASGYSVAA